MEKTLGKRLRSEAVINGRTQKAGYMKFAKPGLKKWRVQQGEPADQAIPVPPDWAPKATLPKVWGPAAWTK
jgi:hydroxymethylglutaryl-CoA lyase